MIKAKLIALTQPLIELRVPDAERLIAYCALVSNPQSQDKELGTLLDYCIRNKHWSIFQMCNAVVEIEAPRDITRQFTRHSSFYTPGDPFEAPGFNLEYGGVQEFSQRYSDQIETCPREARRQDSKNRQNSVDDLKEELKVDFKDAISALAVGTVGMYQLMISEGIAKECARVVLPEGLTMSKLYANGTVRSWLHYVDVRDDEGVTQWEHVLLAREIRKVLTPAFPNIFKEVV